MTDNPPRKHHYVPEGYIRAWAGVNREVTVLTRTPVGRVVARRGSPASVMFDWDVYADQTHDLTDVKAHWLELDYLQTLDNTGAKLQRDMLVGRMPSIGSGRRDWVRFLLSLLNRHPDDVDTLRRLHAVMWKQHEDEGIRSMRASLPDMDPILVATNYIEAWRAKAETSRVESLERMMNYGLSGQILERSHWEVLDLSASSTSLILSDKPIYRSKTFRERGDYIAVPLGPKHLFRASLDWRRGRPFSPREAQMFVAKINTALLKASRSYVVAVDAGLREDAQQLMGSEPVQSIAEIMAEPFGL